MPDRSGQISHGTDVHAAPLPGGQLTSAELLLHTEPQKTPIPNPFRSQASLRAAQPIATEEVQLQNKFLCSVSIVSHSFSAPMHASVQREDRRDVFLAAWAEKWCQLLILSKDEFCEGPKQSAAIHKREPQPRMVITHRKTLQGPRWDLSLLI